MKTTNGLVFCQFDCVQMQGERDSRISEACWHVCEASTNTNIVRHGLGNPTPTICNTSSVAFASRSLSPEIHHHLLNQSDEPMFTRSIPYFIFPRATNTCPQSLKIVENPISHFICVNPPELGSNALRREENFLLTCLIPCVRIGLHLNSFGFGGWQLR